MTSLSPSSSLIEKNTRINFFEYLELTKYLDRNEQKTTWDLNEIKRKNHSYANFQPPKTALYNNNSIYSQSRKVSRIYGILKLKS